MKTVKEFMNENVVCLSPNDTIFDAAKILSQLNIAGAPVVKNDKIIGIVSISDMIKFIDIKLGKLPKIDTPGLSTLLLALVQMQKVHSDFKKELELDISDEKLKRHLKEKYDLSLKAFRTTHEVISKLSNEIAQLKTMEYDLKKKFEKIAKSNHLKVKSKIQFLLAINDELAYRDLKRNINTSKSWLNSVIETLLKNNIIGYNVKKDTYYLIF